MGAEAGKEFGAQNPLSQGLVNERASSRLADVADVEPYDPRQELGAAELRILYRVEALAKRRKDARPGLWIAVVIYVLFSVSDLLLIPDVAAYTITARFAVGLTALLTLETQLRRGVATEWLDVTCAAPSSLAISVGCARHPWGPTRKASPTIWFSAPFS